MRLGLALRIWPVFALKGYWIKPQNRPRTNVIINSPKLRQRLMLSDMMPIHSKIVGLFLGAILTGGQTDVRTALVFRIQAIKQGNIVVSSGR